MDDGPRGNERLTGSLAVLLLVLLAIEGATLLVMRQAILLHIFLGMVLVAVVAIKIGSTLYRFVRYYMGSAPYRRRGPPAVIPRLLGPAVVVLTVLLMFTGVALLAMPAGPSGMLTFHKAVFVLWFGAMSLHVLMHLVDLVGPGVADWRPGGHRLAGVVGRRSLVVAGLVVGVVLGVALLPASSAWVHYMSGGGPPG